MEGSTSSRFNQWLQISKGKWILHTVCGNAVELQMSPVQNSYSTPIKFNELENQTIRKNWTDSFSAE